MIDERVTEALTSLADGPTPPPTSLASDLARGRRRLRVRRATTAAGGVLGAAAVTTAVLVGSHALQPDAAPRLAASGSVVAPAGDGSQANADTQPPAPLPEADPPASTADLGQRVLDAVNRHLAPGRSQPLTVTDPPAWGSARDGSAVVAVMVPFGAAEGHRTTTGVEITFERTGPECDPKDTRIRCRQVTLGGVTTTEITFDGGFVASYYHQNTEGAWVSVQAVRGVGTGQPGDATFSFDTTPWPELGFDRDDLGPLLTDPALDVPVPAS